MRPAKYSIPVDGVLIPTRWLLAASPNQKSPARFMPGGWGMLQVKEKDHQHCDERSGDYGGCQVLAG
jgi:hypothetical protein